MSSIRLPLFSLILFLSLGMFGCSRANKRGDLVFINGAEPETLDPALITGQPEGRVVHALFEGLLRFDAGGRAVAGMAERWEVSPDGRTYTFYLRPEGVWSDGRAVRAEDFVNAWKRVLSPETGSAYVEQLHYIKNARAFSGGEVGFDAVGVKALDERTLRVELENPTPFFLTLCATPVFKPVRTDVIGRVGDDWVKPDQIVTNGAFLLESWRINDKIRLRKNPQYWDAANVRLRSVDILPISKANTAFNFYMSGGADLLMDKGLVPSTLVLELARRRDFHAAPFLGIYFLRFNCSKKPFDDVRVRKAFAMCIDKERIVHGITRAGELVASGFVPPGLEGYEQAEGVGYDPEGAKKLLAEAGYPNGKGLPLITYLYSEGEMNEAIAIELQSMWFQGLGVMVNLARQEWKVYLNSLGNLDYSIARSSWVGDYPDPNTFLDLFLSGSGNNRTGWGNEEYNALLATAAREVDPARRLQILREAENLLVQKQVPVCPLYFYVGIQIYDADKVGGIHGNILDEHPIRTMYRGDFSGNVFNENF